MGKIKNRDRKRAKAGIFSTGAAGCGNSGPPPPDKRELDHPCPHCERIFKQHGRLKEHVLRHHGDAADSEKAEPGPNQNPNPVVVGNRTGISIRDVGSANGYYTHKSPKLQLLEWCQRQSRRRPIYKTFTTQSGKHKCKVILPDMKDARKDIVLFLDDRFMSDETGAEIQQLGATAALCHVAGDCGFQRSLPPQYIDVWSHYKVIYDEEKKQKEKEEPLPPPKKLEREPQAIVMNRAKQEVLEKTLLQLHPPEDIAMGFRFPMEWRNLQQRLMKDGFPKHRIEQAFYHVAQNAPGPVVESVLDWLCFYLDDTELPKTFTKRSKTFTVDVIKAPVAEAVQEEEAEWSETDDPDVDALLQYGYPLPAVIQALEDTSSDSRSAHRSLYSQLTGLSLTETPMKEEDEGSPWHEECEALTAIYDSRCRVLSADSVEVQIEILDELLNRDNSQIWKRDRRKDASRILFSVREVGEDYPFTLPLMALSCEAMKYSFLRYLTVQLAEKSTELVGMPLVHEVMDTLVELLRSAADPNFKLPVQDNEPLPELEESESELEEIPSMGNLNLDAANQNDPKPRPPPRQWSLSEARIENAELQRQLTKLHEDSSAPQAFLSRRKLPAAEFAHHIVEEVRQHEAIVITGMPGCGKSTQVPQFLLDDFIASGHGTECNIICTQPRRISATSLASRVADERAESMGGTIGYSVRNQTKHSKRTRILYCTTGILLRRFVSDPTLMNVSHVLVDEVHERSVEMDLLLLLLRKLLQKSKNQRSGVQCPKIILMSATANAEDFQTYFAQLVGDVPILNIPGFAYPVREFLLEDVHHALSETEDRPKNGWEDVDSSDASDDGYTSRRSSKKKKADEMQVFVIRTKKGATSHVPQVDYRLIEKLVGYIVRNEHDRGPGFLVQNWSEAPNGSGMCPKENGAILIFLPGAAEIDQMARVLKSSTEIPSFKQVRVLPLHASLPPSDQKRVFEDFGEDVRKIIVSTNVAETSVTIPDVTVVIDHCLAKEVGYDAERRISRLKLSWISKASAKQRAGRAGRVQCGVCFRLISADHWERLRDHTPPEISRTPLQSFCLTVLSLMGRGVSLQKQLRECLTPPAAAQVESAMTTLQDVGAIDDRQRLTALGLHLMKMPMDVHMGKMLIYGAMLRCVDSVLTLAAAMAYGKPLFVSPMDKREQADAAKMEMYAPYQNAKSDHMAIISAVQAFRQTSLRKGSGRAAAFCRERFLSADTMFAILDGRVEYVRILADLGFVSQAYSKKIGDESSDNDPYYDAFAGNSKFVRAALCAGFYPNLIRAKLPPKKFVATVGGAKEVDADSKQIKLYDREKGRVFLHPASVNFKVPVFESEWLVYSDIVETGKVYVRQCSMVPIYSMLVFSGGHVRLQHREGLLVLPSWRAKFFVHPKVGVMIKMLRKEVEHILASRIERPETETTENPIITAVMALLETDGF